MKHSSLILALSFTVLTWGSPLNAMDKVGMPTPNEEPAQEKSLHSDNSGLYDANHSGVLSTWECPDEYMSNPLNQAGFWGDRINGAPMRSINTMECDESTLGMFQSSDDSQKMTRNIHDEKWLDLCEYMSNPLNQAGFWGDRINGAPMRSINTIECDETTLGMLLSSDDSQKMTRDTLYEKWLDLYKAGIFENGVRVGGGKELDESTLPSLGVDESNLGQSSFNLTFPENGIDLSKSTLQKLGLLSISTSVQQG